MQIAANNLLKLLLVYPAILFLSSCVPVSYTSDNASQNEELVTFKNKLYESNIRTVRLYVDKGYKSAINEPAVNDIRQQQPFVLEFDEISEDAGYYQARILHCDKNWKKSSLQAIEYLVESQGVSVDRYIELCRLLPVVLPLVLLPSLTAFPLFLAFWLLRRKISIEVAQWQFRTS